MESSQSRVNWRGRKVGFWEWLDDEPGGSSLWPGEWMKPNRLVVYPFDLEPVGIGYVVVSKDSILWPVQDFNESRMPGRHRALLSNYVQIWHNYRYPLFTGIPFPMRLFQSRKLP